MPLEWIEGPLFLPLSFHFTPVHFNVRTITNLELVVGFAQANTLDNPECSKSICHLDF